MHIHPWPLRDTTELFKQSTYTLVLFVAPHCKLLCALWISSSKFRWKINAWPFNPGVSKLWPFLGTQTHSFVKALSIMALLSSSNRDTGPTRPKMLLSTPLQKNVANPCLILDSFKAYTNFLIFSCQRKSAKRHPLYCFSKVQPKGKNVFRSKPKSWTRQAALVSSQVRFPHSGRGPLPPPKKFKIIIGGETVQFFD